METATAFQGTDIPLARWADVLLMYAEAEVRKNNAAPSADAIAAVNEVRKRAGLGIFRHRQQRMLKLSWMLYLRKEDMKCCMKGCVK